MGEREVSRPYRIVFFAEGERFFILLAMPPTSYEVGGIAKRLFFMFLFQRPQYCNNLQFQEATLNI